MLNAWLVEHWLIPKMSSAEIIFSEIDVTRALNLSEMSKKILASTMKEWA